MRARGILTKFTDGVELGLHPELGRSNIDPQVAVALKNRHSNSQKCSTTRVEERVGQKVRDAGLNDTMLRRTTSINKG